MKDIRNGKIWLATGGTKVVECRSLLTARVLIPETTYQSILLKQRAELHRQIGQALEDLRANRIEEFVPLIAHHFYGAGDDRSLKYDLMAGEKSARLYANVVSTKPENSLYSPRTYSGYGRRLP